MVPPEVRVTYGRVRRTRRVTHILTKLPILYLYVLVVPKSPYTIISSTSTYPSHLYNSLPLNFWPIRTIKTSTWTNDSLPIVDKENQRETKREMKETMKENERDNFHFSLFPVNNIHFGSRSEGQEGSGKVPSSHNRSKVVPYLTWGTPRVGDGTGA